MFFRLASPISAPSNHSQPNYQKSTNYIFQTIFISFPMSGYILSGPPSYQSLSLSTLLWSTFRVTLRRLFHQSLTPNWTWTMEVSMEFMREQMKIAKGMKVEEARVYEDALLFSFASAERVDVEQLVEEGVGVKGKWVVPKTITSNDEDDGIITLLWLHGGGYAFHSKAHDNLVALVACACNAKAFALDYRLAPEHKYPAQLEDALVGYRWLLEGRKVDKLVVAGDSAGGNLLLALLLKLKEMKLPQPALGIGICPWVYAGPRGASIKANAKFDWISEDWVVTFGEWFRGDIPADDPRVSPLMSKELRGIAPLLIQTGTKEVIYDMICEFGRVAKDQGCKIELQEYAEMAHDFQAYGDDLVESKAALEAIGKAVDRHCRST